MKSNYELASDLYAASSTKLEFCKALFKLFPNRQVFIELAIHCGMTHAGALTYYQNNRKHDTLAKQQDLRQLVDRFMHTADSISEDEMRQLDRYFTALENALSICPPEYRLVSNDVHLRLNRVRDALAAYKSR